MAMISPSYWENIPAEILPRFLQITAAHPDNALAHTPGLLPNSNVLIPRDNKDYRNEFNFVENDLYNDRSLASSVVRVVSIDIKEPPQIFLGNELPAKKRDVNTNPQELWLGNLDLQPPDVPGEPDLDKEQNPQSFMIVPPINALIEFTRDLALSDPESGNSYSSNLTNCDVEMESNLSNPKTIGFAFTSVSDPIKITRHVQRRFWRKNQSSYVAYRGFSGYVKRIFKKDNAPRPKSSIKQWAQTRNLIFWEHSQSPESSSFHKQVSTS